MKSIFISMLVSLASQLFIVSAYAGTTTAFSLGTQSYAGSVDRNYKVYQPAGLTGPVPMVMVLHGCSQNEQNIMGASDQWGMQAAADQYGFILVAPFITSYDGARNQNCWGFWFGQHTHEGMGEPEDLHQIALQVEANYSIDPGRRYITGLSSGGAMAVVAAVTHNEYWAASAAAAGLPYSETSSSVNLSGCFYKNASFKSIDAVAAAMSSEMDDTYQIPMMILGNRNDCTVLEQAAKNIRDSMLQLYDMPIDNVGNYVVAANPACEWYHQNNYACQHAIYEDAFGKSLVETVLFSGPENTASSSDTDHGHYWVSGVNGTEGDWAVKTGPSYPDLIWDFFDRHPRTGGGTNGNPSMNLNGENPMELELNATFIDPGATATDPEDGSLVVTADCSAVDTAQVDEYICSYSAQDSDSHTVQQSRIVIVYDPTIPPANCAESTMTASNHVTAGQAQYGWWGTVTSTGDSVYIGSTYSSTDVTLYQGTDDLWYAIKPAECNSTTPPPSGSCWTEPVSVHMSAGRAQTYGGYVCQTVGGGDQIPDFFYTCEYLSAFGGDSSLSIQETSTGIFNKLSSCQ